MVALMEVYVEGILARKVEDITWALCGNSFSKSLVSLLAASMPSCKCGGAVATTPKRLPLLVRGRPLREGEGWSIRSRARISCGLDGAPTGQIARNRSHVGSQHRV